MKKKHVKVLLWEDEEDFFRFTFFSGLDRFRISEGRLQLEKSRLCFFLLRNNNDFTLVSFFLIELIIKQKS